LIEDHEGTVHLPANRSDSRIQRSVRQPCLRGRGSFAAADGDCDSCQEKPTDAGTPGTEGSRGWSAWHQGWQLYEAPSQTFSQGLVELGQAVPAALGASEQVAVPLQTTVSQGPLTVHETAVPAHRPLALQVSL